MPKISSSPKRGLLQYYFASFSKAATNRKFIPVSINVREAMGSYQKSCSIIKHMCYFGEKCIPLERIGPVTISSGGFFHR